MREILLLLHDLVYNATKPGRIPSSFTNLELHDLECCLTTIKS